MGATDPSGSEFRRMVRIDQLGHDEQRFHYVASDAERTALATRYGILALERLEAEVFIQRIREGGARARVNFAADVIQSCVVTLEPVAAHLADAFELDFLPEGDAEEAVAAEFEALADEPPGMVVDGAFDVGEVIAEYVSLAIDPYPRKPGVEFAGVDAAGNRRGVKEELDGGPFAALKDWKGKA